MMRMIRPLDLARRSKASFKTHVALVESLAQSDETLHVIQWWPAFIARVFHLTVSWVPRMISPHGLEVADRLARSWGRNQQLRFFIRYSDREGRRIRSADLLWRKPIERIYFGVTGSPSA